MKNARAYLHEQLDAFYPEEEVNALIRWIMEDVCHLPPYRLLLAESVLSEEQRTKIEQLTERLVRQEPIQYIMNGTYFCDLPFYLTHDVLIPRFETAELVKEIIVDYAKTQSVRILDIGTGSGCIAISLSISLPDAIIEALDISEAALQVAKKNAEINHANVHFIRQDILTDSVLDVLGLYDCIVSNPPYVTEREKKTMARNVLDYEPHVALFVPDDDPLCFYRRIAQLGHQHLREKGRLYFEINEQYGKEMLCLLEREGYRNIELKRDFYGKDRMIKAEL